MPIPTTPIAWLNWLANLPEEQPKALTRTRRITGDLSVVHTIVLLVLHRHAVTDRRPLTTHTISLESGRSISHSQLETLEERGHVTQAKINSPDHGTVTGWSLRPECVQRMAAINLGLTAMLASIRRGIAIQHELSELLADHLSEPAARFLKADTQLTIRPSVHHAIINAIETRFQFTFADADLAAITCVGDLSRIIKRHSAS
jgi:hypothetical protein